MSQRNSSGVGILTSECSPELNGQLEAVIGGHFNINRLRQRLGKRNLFQEARGTVYSFTPNVEVRTAQQQIFDQTYFSLSCEADSGGFEETASYRMKSYQDEDGTYEDHAIVEISPNALRVLYRPAHDILESLNPRLSEEVLEYDAADIAYRGLFAGIVAQTAVKMHALAHIGSEPHLREDIPAKIDQQYEAFFGKDKIEAWDARLNRLAMALGGAVMLRSTVNHILEKLGATGDARTVGLPLQLYAEGRKEAQPVDQQQASFAMAHAMRPREAARFMVSWFTEEPPKRPSLTVVK